MAPYESPLRREQAAATRRRVVAAAAACFSEHGYAGTTLRSIAQRAGVSTETVQASGPKRALLVAAFSLLVTGDPAERELAEHPVVAGILAGTDGTVILGQLAQWLAASNRRVADLWQALVASASDEPEVAAYLARLHGRVRQEATQVIADLSARGLLDPPRSAARTADLLWNAQTPDGYLRLVRQAGWSHRAYTSYLADTLVHLCAPVGPHP